MTKLWNYLKTHRREKVSGMRLFAALLGAASAYLWLSQEETWLGILWGITALMWGYQAVFISDKEREMEKETIDPRPMDEKLREAFAGLTAEELQAVLDDDLRSEETKAVARELLEK